FDRRHATRREFRTRVLWQNKKAPGVGLGALGRQTEFRFETDLGHFLRRSPKKSDRIIVVSPRQSRQVRIGNCCRPRFEATILGSQTPWICLGPASECDMESNRSSFSANNCPLMPWRPTPNSQIKYP